MKTAVLIPCFNEAAAIASVVRGFRAALPDADIYVFDNNSTDDSVRLAAAAGAVVRSETRQGKGNVVRRMFADVEADVYLLVDGDGTYDAGSAPLLMEALRRLRMGDPRFGIRENPEFKVIIRGDRNISYRSLDPVLLACVDANVKNVTFNTAKP